VYQPSTLNRIRVPFQQAHSEHTACAEQDRQRKLQQDTQRLVDRLCIRAGDFEGSENEKAGDRILEFYMLAEEKFRMDRGVRMRSVMVVSLLNFPFHDIESDLPPLIGPLASGCGKPPKC